MKLLVDLLWMFLTVLGALALAHVVGVVKPNEKLNGLWLVVTAACLADVVRFPKVQIYE